MLSNLKSLTTTASSIVGTLRVADKEVQTDFPVALLEHYVVNNRKRILKLLGFTNATANNPSIKSASNRPRSGLNPSTSLQLDRPQNLPLYSSWNTLQGSQVRKNLQWRAIQTSLLPVYDVKRGHFERAKRTLKVLPAS